MNRIYNEVASTYSELKSCKPEPGEVSPLNSSTSSKKDDSLKRDREIHNLNDSEEEGDLLEDEDEVRGGCEAMISCWFYRLFFKTVKSAQSPW